MSSALDKPSNIVVVVPELLPVPACRGGAIEHWVEVFLKKAQANNVKFSVISRPKDPGVTGIPGVEHIEIPWTRLDKWFHALKERVTWKNPLRFAAKIQNVASYGRRVAKYAAPFDVVYVHNEPNLLLFLNKREGQKIVLHMHNDHLLSRLLRPVNKIALRKSDSVIFVSRFVRDNAARAFPEFAYKFSFVLNGTDSLEFKPIDRDQALKEFQSIVTLPREGRYILFVGRLAEVKGVHVLVEAFRLVRKRVQNAKLLIAGASFFAGSHTTDYERNLAESIRDLKDDVIFTGFIRHEQLHYAYSIADVVSVPSIWGDPCPLVVLEAMASGCRVVGSSVGGIPEMIRDGDTGWLVEAGNPDRLADAIVAVLENPENASRIAASARESVRQYYHWDRLIAEVMRHLERGGK